VADFNETWIFEKSTNIEFHENPSSGSRVIACGQTNGRTDKKLIVLFRYFANAPKIVDTNPHTELGFQFTLTVFEQ
jgi:hypothetical protein